MKKKIIALIVALTCIFSGSLTVLSDGELLDECGENLTWTLDSKGVLTISGTGDMYNCQFEYSPWYLDTDKITAIEIGSGVTSIGDMIFMDCEKVSSITIPDSVTRIGNRAFGGCDGLTSVTIPANVTSIGVAPFVACEGLTNIIVDKGNPNYMSDENGVLFNKDKTELIQYPIGKKDTMYYVPDGVLTIKDCAFQNAKNLESVEISSGVTAIAEMAFCDCTNLRTLTIPDTVTNFYDWAIIACNKVEILGFPGSAAEVYANKNKIPFTAHGGGNTNVNITLPTFKVTLGGREMDNTFAKYPLIIYNDITYFPMTYFDSRLLGLETEYTLETGLAIKPLVGEAPEYQSEKAETQNMDAYVATIANGEISVNGKAIDNSAEEYPLLLFRDVTYFPLTWRFAVEEFGWSYSFDLTNGLVVGKAG